MTEQRPDVTTPAEADPMSTTRSPELMRQNSRLELIASENFTSGSRARSAGTVLTNKLRPRDIQENDITAAASTSMFVETLAIERAKQLFMPSTPTCSRTQAAGRTWPPIWPFSSLATPSSDELSHGGHLTHGSPSISPASLTKVVPYGVSPENEQIDYDELAKLATEHKRR